MKKFAAMVAAVSIVALGTLAYGEMSSYGMEPEIMSGCGMENQMMVVDHLRSLNLNEQQKAFINETKTRMMKETIKRTADMRIAQIELKDLLNQEPMDMKAVEAKVKQLGILKTEMYLFHIKAMEDYKTKLTSEQRIKLREMNEAGSMMEGMRLKQSQEHGMMGK